MIPACKLRNYASILLVNFLLRSNIGKYFVVAYNSGRSIVTAGLYGQNECFFLHIIDYFCFMRFLGKVMRFIGRFIKYSLISVFVLLIAFAIAIQTSSFQTFLGERASAWLSKELHTT